MKLDAIHHILRRFVQQHEPPRATREPEAERYCCEFAAVDGERRVCGRRKDREEAERC